MKPLSAMIALCALIPTFSHARAPDIAMRVTLLGTGTPIPSAEMAGPATLVQAGGLDLLFDAGRNATVGLAGQGIDPGAVDAVFLTHMHSDHFVGLSDLLLTGILPYSSHRRTTALPLYGPPEVVDLAEGFRIAFEPDLQIRAASLNIPKTGGYLSANAIADEGALFVQGGVTVTAFKVPHGAFIEPAYGYRVDYRGRSVVISGDTAYSENLIDHARGADVIVHEVFAANPEVSDSEVGKTLASQHTSPERVAEVFAATGPGLGVFSHIVLLPPDPPKIDDILTRAQTVHDGPMALGRDGLAIEVMSDGSIVMPDEE